MIRHSADVTKLRDVLGCDIGAGRVYADSSSTTGAGSQKLTLLVLWAMEGQAISCRAIADIACISHCQAHRAVHLLHRDGLIDRVPNGNNTVSIYTINTAACRTRRSEDIPLVLAKGRNAAATVDNIGA